MLKWRRTEEIDTSVNDMERIERGDTDIEMKMVKGMSVKMTGESGSQVSTGSLGRRV